MNFERAVRRSLADYGESMGDWGFQVLGWRCVQRPSSWIERSSFCRRASAVTKKTVATETQSELNFHVNKNLIKFSPALPNGLILYVLLLNSKLYLTNLFSLLYFISVFLHVVLHNVVQLVLHNYVELYLIVVGLRRIDQD